MPRYFVKVTRNAIMTRTVEVEAADADEAHAARAIAEDEASALRALLVRAREVINEHACGETVLLDDIDTALAARAQERES